MNRIALHWPLAACLLCVLLIWNPLFIGFARDFNGDVFASALAVYAVLRGINAALSVAKETEIGVDLVGSITAQPAMILDPIDETVARVADAVFLLAATSGVLEIAFAPVARIGALMAAAGFALVYLPALLPAAAGPVAATGRALAGFGLVLALALPLGYGVGGYLGAVWTRDVLTEAEAMLRGSAESIETAFEAVQDPAPGPPVDRPGPEPAGAPPTEDWLGSVVGPVFETFEQAGEAASGAFADLSERVGSAGQAVGDALPSMAAVQERGGEILESSLTIVAVYAFRLLVLPLILLWIVVVLARLALDAPARRGS